MRYSTATSPVEDSELLSHTNVSAPDQASDDDGDDHQLIEVAHDGRTYQVPRGVAPALARQADHARQVEDLAEERRAWEQERDRQADGGEARGQLKGAIGALAGQVRQFEHMDWQALNDHSPAKAAHLWDQFQGLRQTLEEALSLHAHAEAHDAAEAQRAHARQVEDGHAVLARDVPGWSPEMAAKLAAYGRDEHGFSADELSSVADPRLVKLLHAAFVASQQAKAQRIAQGQKTEPARGVRGNGGNFAIAPDTYDFAAFEKLADARLKRRR